MDSVLATGANALQAAHRDVTIAADKTVRAAFPGLGDDTNLAEGLVGLMMAENAGKAASKIITTADAMMGSLLDILA